MAHGAVEKYETRAKKVGSLLCVGLDSDISKIPNKYLKEEYPQFSFNKDIIDQTHPYVSAYKPNSAFYEAEGVKGLESLKKTCEYLREKYPDIFTILDVKRGDIGNTNIGYATFIFDHLKADSFTLHPYLGLESVRDIISQKDKVFIILVKTSNSGSGEFQDLRIEGTNKKLWEIIAESVSTKWNENSNLMMVVGGTYPEEIKIARDIVGNMTLLVPGIGAQGGDIEKVVRRGVNESGLGLIINSSRDIIFSENPAIKAKKLRDTINSFI